MLIQQRAFDKYHGSGIWANATCSHPRPWENYLEAAHRRLQEEMGFDCPLEKRFSFIYKADFPNGLTEWELDRVFVGIYDWEVVPNPTEVHDFRWIDIKELRQEIEEKPASFAPWFKIIMEKLREIF